MDKTSQQYDHVITVCQDIFTKKMKDYGIAWRILRPSSMTDQIYIKAQRIRSIEQKGISKIDEGVRSEYIGIVNYCIMAIIQLEKGISETDDLTEDETLVLYLKYFAEAKELMLAKNHETANYGVKCTKTCIIENNVFSRDSCFHQIVEHGNRFVVTAVFVVSAHNDVINFFAFVE